MASKITGVKSLKAKLSKKKKQYGSNPSVVVGFTAAYALAVHEKKGMVLKGEPRRSGRGHYWDPQEHATAGFLSIPARNAAIRKRIAFTVRAVTKNTNSLVTGLYMGGLILQREAQQRTPVDSGNLRASATTRIEKQ